MVFYAKFKFSAICISDLSMNQKLLNLVVVDWSLIECENHSDKQANDYDKLNPKCS